MPIPSLRDLRDDLDAGTLTAVAMAEDAFARIDRLEGGLNALAGWDRTEALQAAETADRRLQAGGRGPMLGIPVVLKDNLAQTGSPLGLGSRIQSGYASPYSATVVRRLQEAGAVVVGRAQLDEFALGSSGEHCAAGPARNPWDPTRVPGGSSSGSAVSVAAGYVPFALGSDTGGSVRLPAAFCGVTGLRPSYGVLSRYGLAAMASSLDQVGPLARDARDLALALSVLVGEDPLDSTSCPLPGSEGLARLQPGSMKGLRVGLPVEYVAEGLEPGVKAVLDAALRVLEELGATLVELSLPHTAYALDTYALLNTAELTGNLARFDGVRYGARREGPGYDGMVAATRALGFGPEVKRRILLGTFALSRGHAEDFYLRAQKARTLIARDFEEAFRSVDLLATPTSPCVAFPLGSRVSDPLAMHLSDLCNVAPALAALPCLSLPAGRSEGLPVGLQLVGPRGSDPRLLAWGWAFQSATTHHLEAPEL